MEFDFLSNKITKLGFKIERQKPISIVYKENYINSFKVCRKENRFANKLQRYQIKRRD